VIHPTTETEMRESLSKTVQEVVRSANKTARQFNKEYVGTEHLLLAIARQSDTTGARILEEHGVTPAKLHKQIDRLAKASMEDTWVFGRLPGTPHFKNVVARAIEQARQYETSIICTQHILLGLLMEKGSIAQLALENVGVTIKSVKKLKELMSKTEE
jgi:ATP-dependent Clp protease ATP-binding subunit ClpC